MTDQSESLLEVVGRAIAFMEEQKAQIEDLRITVDTLNGRLARLRREATCVCGGLRMISYDLLGHNQNPRDYAAALCTNLQNCIASTLDREEDDD